MNSNLVMLREPKIGFGIKLTREHLMQLLHIAYTLDCVNRTGPSLSELMQQIAMGTLTVVPTNRVVQDGDFTLVMPTSEEDIPD